MDYIGFVSLLVIYENGVKLHEPLNVILPMLTILIRKPYLEYIEAILQTTGLMLKVNYTKITTLLMYTLLCVQVERERLLTDEKLSRAEKEIADTEQSFSSLAKENQEVVGQVDDLQQRLTETEEKAEHKLVHYCLWSEEKYQCIVVVFKVQSTVNSLHEACLLLFSRLFYCIL